MRFKNKPLIITIVYFSAKHDVSNGDGRQPGRAADAGPGQPGSHDPHDSTFRRSWHPSTATVSLEHTHKNSMWCACSM